MHVYHRLICVEFCRFYENKLHSVFKICKLVRRYKINIMTQKTFSQHGRENVFLHIRTAS